MLLLKGARPARRAFWGWNVGVGLAGGVVLPLLLSWADPLTYFGLTTCLVDLTVLVRGPAGPQELLVRQLGTVVLDYDGEQHTAPIDKQGRAVFSHLRRGATIHLGLSGAWPRQALRPDSEYVVPGSGVLRLPAVFRGLDRVRGRVLAGNDPLPGVAVSIDELADTTNAAGAFTIAIPAARQGQDYTIWFIRRGFVSQKYLVRPLANDPIEVSMEKAPARLVRTGQ